MILGNLKQHKKTYFLLQIGDERWMFAWSQRNFLHRFGHRPTFFTVAVISLIGSMLSSCAIEDTKGDASKKQSMKMKDASHKATNEYPQDESSSTYSMLTPDQAIEAARTAYQNKEFEETFRLADSVVKRQPQLGEAYFLRGVGVYYSASGEETDAINDLQTASRLNYRTNELYTILSSLYQRRREYGNAIAALTQGLEVIPPKDAPTVDVFRYKDQYRFRAALYADQGKLELALADMNKCLVPPSKSIGFAVRANLLDRMGRTKEALADYARAAKANPKNTQTLTSSAILLAKVGRNEEALKQISGVFAIDPENNEALRVRGDIHSNLKQYEQAVRDYSKSIELGPEHCRASYEGRSRAYEKMGRLDLAEKDRVQASKTTDRAEESSASETMGNHE